MAAVEVSAVVCSLTAAFRSGTEIVQRLRDRRRLRKRTKGGQERVRATPLAVLPHVRRVEDDEEELSLSFSKGPAEIRREYERGLARVGQGFAKGDSIARASLAETLLKLNTGLANIISSYLLVHERGPVTQLDYVSLLRLSEDSRKNAVAALGSLQQRLSSSRTLVAARNLEQEQSSRTKGKSVRGTKQKKSSSSQGAWVKKKPKRKTSSIASTAASTAGSTSTSAASSKSSTSKAPAASATAIVTQYLPPPRSTRHQFPSIQTKLAVKQSPTPPPSYDSHYYHQVFQQQAITAVAPVSGKGLVPGPRLNAQIRQITPSVYSFASDSTRLGEIPEYKIIRYDPTKYSALAEEYPVEKKAPTASVAPIPASLAGSSSGSEVAASSYGTNSAAGRKSKKFWGWNLFRKGTSQRGSDSGSVVVY